jgi:hypothetical protein
MGINFFDPCCQTTTSAIEFGLCDDPPPPNVPAYVDTTDRDKWIAIVQNPDKINVTFTAIDSCITITRDNGEDGKRCDAMLTYEDKIIFVELKERNSKGWVDYGIKQLTETIDFFWKSHPLNEYSQKTAYVANKSKPKFQFSQITRIARFKNDTGFRLKIEVNIMID